MLVVPLNSVRVVVEGTHDVWYSCVHCGFGGWARAHARAVGADLGSTPHAAYRARILLPQAAARKVWGCPCPQCKKHYPGVVYWAGVDARATAFRNRWRPVLFYGGLIIGPLLLVATAVMIVKWGFGPKHESEIGAGLVLGGGALVGGLLVQRNWWPDNEGWILYDKVPDSVIFLPTEAYRGAQPGHG